MFEIHKFLSDSAIDNKSDDHLNRQGFVDALSKQLNKWSEEHGLVVGLQGKWGVGKTSIKNMLIEEIDSPGRIVDFSPWKWSESKNLNKEFYQEIVRRLKRIPQLEQGIKNEINRINSLRSKAFLAGKLEKMIPLFWGVAVALGAGLSIDQNHKWVLVTLSLLIAVATTYLQFKLLPKDSSSQLDDFTIRSEAKKFLSKQQKPFIVFIDDIDRMERSRVLELLQLVKTNSELPNVVFVLLYDHACLIKLISSNNLDGQDFIEKIVQAPIPVPLPSKDKINQLFMSYLNKCVESALFKDSEIDQRAFWDFQIFSSNYITDVRSLKRFFSAFSFALTSTSIEDRHDLNIQDLLSVTLLSVFENSVYLKIQKSKDTFTTFSYRTHEKGKHENIYAQTLELFSTQSPNIEDFIWSLFPCSRQLSKGDNHGGYSGSFYDRCLQCRSICRSEYFDAYFLGVDHRSSISRGEIEYCLNREVELEQLQGKINSFFMDKKLEKAIDLLRTYKHEITDAKVAENLIISFFSVADSTEDRGSVDLFSASLNLKIVFFIEDLWGVGLENRLDLLTNAIGLNKGISVISALLVFHSQRVEKGESIILSDEQYESLYSQYIDYVSETITKDVQGVINFKHFSQLFYRLKSKNKADVMIHCIREHVRNNSLSFVKLLRHFEGIQSVNGVVSIKSNKKIISEILELEEAHSLCKVALKNEQDEENILTIQRFIDAYNNGDQNDW